MLTKQEAIAWAGSAEELAKRLGITVQAVYQWEDEVPKLREYEIREMQATESTRADPAV